MRRSGEGVAGGAKGSRAAAVVVARLPRVPRTTQRNPQFNSSQLGLYRDWPKGLLRPPKELHMPTSPTAKQLAPRSASWGQLPAVNLGESVRSVVR